MTIYLKFNSREEAISTLESYGAVFDEFHEHFVGLGWGTLLNYNDEWLVNVYDYSGNVFDGIKLQPPVTPFNKRAGE